jgi:hypothetical protein
MEKCGHFSPIICSSHGSTDKNSFIFHGKFELFLLLVAYLPSDEN